MRAIETQLLSGSALYEEVVKNRLSKARESVFISTANVKAMFVDTGSQGFRSIIEVFKELARNRVELRILHAEIPSRPFRAAFDKARKLVEGGLELKICPRVHFKTVIVDSAWVYLGSANLTGAGLGAKGDDKRNFEMGFVTEDFEVIDHAASLFESIWTGRECGTCKLRSTCPDPIGPPARKRTQRGARDRDSSGPLENGGPIRLGKARRFSRPR